jgi:putative phosphotransacetylase
MSELLKSRYETPIPVGVSNRHVHLCQADWNFLFGEGTQPRKFRSVKQPGFWACYETVSLEGPKGKIENVRLIAPHRKKTQVEIAKTDASQLGLRPPVRGSGDLGGSSPIKISGPKGALEVKEGLVIASRHIHFSPSEAETMGIQEGEIVSVRAGIGGPRELVFTNVLCRISTDFSLEFHIDTDEANAAWVKTGDYVYIQK